MPSILNTTALFIPFRSGEYTITKEKKQIPGKGDKGQKVRLGGTFTNWDSWIYELTEITPGNYEIKLPLPPGKYYYAFYTGLESFADPANPKKAYREDGKTVSEITVK